MKASKILMCLAFMSMILVGCKKGGQPTSTPTSESSEVTHEFKDPTYLWADDYSKCTATRECIDDPTLTVVEEKQSVYTKIEPDCEIDGEERWTVTFEHDFFEVQTHIQVLDHLGHDWGEPEYEWNEGYTACTAKRVCSRNPEHVDKETQLAFIDYRDSTYEEEGFEERIVSFTKSYFQTQIHHEDIPVKNDLQFVDWGDKIGCAYSGNFLSDEIVIPEKYHNKPVTAVTTVNGQTGFMNTTQIKKVTLPTSIEGVVSNGFGFCNVEEVVNLPTDNDFEYVFNGNNSLRRVEMLPTFEIISAYKFKFPASFQELVAKGVVTIKRDAFDYAQNLKKLVLGDALNKIEDYAFGEAINLREIIVGADCEKFFVEDNVLYSRTNSGPQLELYPASRDGDTYVAPDGTWGLRTHCFENSQNLKNLVLPASCVYFASEVFMRSSIESIHFEAANNQIYVEAFREVYNLKTVTLGDNVSNLIYEGGCLIKKINNTSGQLLTIMPARTIKIEVPAIVNQTISTDAIRYCKADSFSVDPDNTMLSAYNGTLMSKDHTSLIRMPNVSEKQIGQDRLHADITSIGGYAFGHNENITAVDLSSRPAITSLGSSCFTGCTNLSSVTLPSGLTEIKFRTFYDCTGLHYINYPKTLAEFQAISRGSDWKRNVPSDCQVVCSDQTVDISTIG